jgi:hypothetical protein
MALKVNVTQEEASSKVLEPIPSGWYIANITDVEMAEVKSAPKPGKKDNRGEPFYKMELTIESPEKHEGRKVWTNVMLFSGALYSAVQLVGAVGGVVPEGEGSLEIPEPEELLGKTVAIKVAITGERTVDVNGEKKTYEPRNDVKGFKAPDADVLGKIAGGAATSKGSSLLPS